MQGREAGGVRTKGERPRLVRMWRHGNSDDRDRRQNRAMTQEPQPRHLPRFPSSAAHTPWQIPRLCARVARFPCVAHGVRVFGAAPRMAGSRRPSPQARTGFFLFPNRLVARVFIPVPWRRQAGRKSDGRTASSLASVSQVGLNRRQVSN
jgi:hypothetical protein